MIKNISSIIEFIFKFVRGNKNLVLIYIFSILAGLFGYLVKIFFARVLTPEEFGILYAMLGFLLFVGIFTDLGFTNSLNYFGVGAYVKKKWEELYFTIFLSFTIRFILSLLIAILLFFSSELLLEYYFKISSEYLFYFYCLLGYFIFFNIKGPLIQIFNINEKYYLVNFFKFLNFFLIVLSGSIIYLVTQKPELTILGYFLGGILNFFISLTIVLFYNKKILNKKIKFNLKKAKEISRFSSSIFLSIVMLIIIKRTDILFIIYFINTLEVGFYEIALSLATIMSLVLLPFITMVQAKVKKLNSENNIKEIKKIISNVEKYLIITGIPFVIILIFLSEIIVKFLFGIEYIESVKLLKYLAIAIFFQMFQNFYFFVLGGLGKVKSRNKILLWGIILNIILNLIGVLIIGSVGVAIASGISFLFMSIMGKKKIKIN